MVELGFGVGEMFGFIMLGMTIGAGFFYPLAVARLIVKAMNA